MQRTGKEIKDIQKGQKRVEIKGPETGREKTDHGKRIDGKERDIES